MLSKVKLRLGILEEDTSKDELISDYLEEALQYIRNFCNIIDIPKELEKVAVRMTADFYKGGAVGGSQAVASIKRGDTTITYENGGSGGTSGSYDGELVSFRKLRW